MMKAIHSTYPTMRPAICPSVSITKSLDVEYPASPWLITHTDKAAKGNGRDTDIRPWWQM